MGRPKLNNTENLGENVMAETTTEVKFVIRTISTTGIPANNMVLPMEAQGYLKNLFTEGWKLYQQDILERLSGGVEIMWTLVK